MDIPTLRREELGSAALDSLFAELNREVDGIYPEEGANHYRLDPAEVSPGRGGCFVLWMGAEPVGCGALRMLDADTGELKRMFVRPAWRGRGLSRRMLRHLEAEARRCGARRLVLETGTRLTASVALYESEGFREIERFGEYANSPLSHCMAKPLD
jgi:putative acetyltransferase